MQSPHNVAWENTQIIVRDILSQEKQNKLFRQFYQKRI